MFTKCRYIVLLTLIPFNVVSGTPPGDKHQFHEGQENLKFEIILPNLYRYKDSSNSYLLKSGSSAILIDACSENIVSYLKEVDVTKIEWVLLTHYHRDQCLGDLKLKQKGSNIAIGVIEKDMLNPAGIMPPFKIPNQFLLNGELQSLFHRIHHPRSRKNEG